MGKVVYNMSDKEYHSLSDTDPHYSSSQIKDALVDIEYFHKRYITKEIENISIPAFDIGHYFHMALLEPQRLAVDTCVWMGDRRYGREWDKFKSDNAGKCVITAKELEQAENLIRATRENPAIMDLLNHDEGKSEVSVFQEIHGVPCKVRFDRLVLTEDGYAIDLKSTTGNAKDVRKTQAKISEYNYDLSAAFYLDVLNAHLKSIGSKLVIRHFYFAFASKDFMNSQMYLASENMLKVGRAKYQKALANIKEAQASKWCFDYSVVTLDPAEWEKAWLDGGEIKTGKYQPSPKARQNKGGSLL